MEKQMNPNKMTLEQTWTYCLKMWKWIAKNYNSQCFVIGLKRQWLKKNGFGDNCIDQKCFFCHYAYRKGGGYKKGCDKCPAIKIDPTFHCKDSSYHFLNNPIAFYAKLVELNKIRKGKEK